MSDEKTNGAQHTQEPALTVNGQYLKDLSFENPNPLESFQNLEGAPEVSVAVDIQATPLEENIFEVALKINANATQGDKSLYVVEVDYAGIFTLAKDLPQENHHPILMIECPRLLFPFARALIADVTREGGYPPLSLVPIDFVTLYRQQMEQMQQGGAPDAAPHKLDA
ncbi:MAG: protein-export chaperone SecB [Alphaproteobacteria bacterium]|jgi:preprotein translocase subunit SecB|nr:protein-export chaperone SecB [Alphaproteobacteria bacterium]